MAQFVSFFLALAILRETEMDVNEIFQCYFEKKKQTNTQVNSNFPWSVLLLTIAGAHQMEPPFPIQALGVNPFPSRFIIRTVPRGDFKRRQWEEPITTTK